MTFNLKQFSSKDTINLENSCEFESSYFDEDINFLR